MNGRYERTFKDYALALLYPPRCVCCDALLPMRAGGWCAPCEARLPRITGAVCLKCGKRVESQEQEYCSDCRKYRHTFDEGRAAFLYTGALRHSVYRMKKENRRDYVPFYAEEIVRALEKQLGRWQPQAVVPIPMHPRKRRRRGYNQSELLARCVSDMTGIPLKKNALRCVRRTEAQKTLDRTARRQNLKGSMEATDEARGLRRILLIDDVYTTGSTMDEAAAVLKEAGAEHVFFGVLCTGKGK